MESEAAFSAAGAAAGAKAAREEQAERTAAASRRCVLEERISPRNDLILVNRSQVAGVERDELRAHHPVFVVLEPAGAVELRRLLVREARQMRHALGNLPPVHPDGVVAADFNQVSREPPQVLPHRDAVLDEGRRLTGLVGVEGVALDRLVLEIDEKEARANAPQNLPVPCDPVAFAEPERAARDSRTEDGCEKEPAEALLRSRFIEAPPFKNRGFTMTLSRLFQGAMSPERHLLNKVFAADLFPVPPCSRNSAS